MAELGALGLGTAGEVRTGKESSGAYGIVWQAWHGEYLKGARIMYSWKPGARIRTKPEVVGSICEKMAIEGRLTAENLVEDSRPVTAPLHNEFTWDDSLAASKWRRQEAMQIIDSLEIHIADNNPVQAFVKISRIETNYHPTQTVITQQDGRQILLNNALRELKNIERKYNHLRELAEVFRAIDEVTP